MKEQQKVMADAFTSVTGICSSYCESCAMWIVHCPECNHNWCGGGCGCGYDMLLNRKQTQLEKMLESINE